MKGSGKRFAAPSQWKPRHGDVPIPAPRRRSLAALVLTGLALPASALSQAPDEDWRVMDTDHFRVTYPVELRALATQVADRAERAYRGLEIQFDEAPGSSIDIVVTDHTDATNGFARVAPWNRITIFAAPPTEGFELAYFDDWVELVVTHELAHIFHLDRRGWLGDLTKAIFGRAPVRWPIFPNSALPTWTVEGLATYYESSLTDAGRVRGSFHEMAVRTAVLEGEFETLQQVSGETQVWPAGNRPYIYGSMFFDHLVREHGRERMAEFAEAVDGQIIPFRMNAAARKSFGANFTDAFLDWTDSLELRYEALERDLELRGGVTRGETLASEGRWALYPRVAPDGATLAFARSDGSSDSQIRVMDAAGRASSKLARANGVSLLDWTPDGKVLFSQFEFADPYRTYKDLYLVDPAGGRPHRVTRGARLDFPSVHPDGRSALAVRQSDGLTWVVRVDLASGEITDVVAPEDGVHWAYPTWSPDGRWIAVSRWQPGAYYDVLVLDAQGRVVDEVTRDRAVDLAPGWSPDGRWLLWASDRTGIPNVLAAEVGSDGRVGQVRQVTNMATGASYPEVDPAGEWLYYSAYHADGWHVERVPFVPSSWLEPGGLDGRFQPGGEAAAQDFPRRIEAEERGYNPFPSLWPRYWEPTLREGETRGGTQVLGSSIGIQTTARDMVERHAVGATLRYEPKGGRFDGGLAYAFSGLGNPVLSVAGEQRYSSAGFTVEDPVEEGQEPVRRNVFLVEREREIRGAVSVIRRRIRQTLTLSLAASYVWESRELLNDALEPDSIFVPTRPTSGLPQLTATVGYNNSRFHAFSISREDGVSGFARLRRRWDATVPDSIAGTPGADASWTDLTGEVRLYKAINLPGFSNHVLAARASGGSAWDSGADAFFYSIGGASGQGERITGLELLSGSNLLFPVRGYDRGVRAGSKAWTASVEYRFPLWRINRALGDFPLYFDWMSGSLFFDAGNAWGPELGVARFDNPRGDAVASAGGELSLNGLPFWTSLTVLRTGVAVPLVESDGARVYVRLGIAF